MRREGGVEPAADEAIDVVNPPFGRKSSTLTVNADGDTEREQALVVRDDFWADTTNEQLKFVQHTYTILDTHGRAAVVLPDNMLFEGGASTVRKRLFDTCDVHTMLRLPTGIFHAGRREGQGPVLRQRARGGDAVDTRPVDLRLPGEPALHDEDRAADLRAPRRLDRRLPPGGPVRSYRVRALPPAPEVLIAEIQDEMAALMVQFSELAACIETSATDLEG